MVGNLTMAQWSALSPAISYWAVSGFYEFVETFNFFSQYRIRPGDEVSKKNLVSKYDVLKQMIIYHIVGTAVLLITNEIWPPPQECQVCFGSFQSFQSLATGALGFPHSFMPMLAAWLMRLAYLACRQFLAVVILDTWVFWGHYIEHKNAWLYRNIHYVHHQLYTPYTYGALYNHWAESLFSDSLGGFLGTKLLQLTDMELIFFYAMVTAKTVEDHASYELPFSPFAIMARFTGNTVSYHVIHHQTWGLKTNFQVYFTWWDRWMNTEYNGPRTLNGPLMTEMVPTGHPPSTSQKETQAAFTHDVDMLMGQTAVKLRST